MKIRHDFKSVLALVLLFVSFSFSKHLLGDINIGVVSGVADTGYNLDGNINVDINLLYRLSDHILTGFEFDANTWSWSNHVPGNSMTDHYHVDDVNLGKGGLLVALRGEEKFGNEVKIFVQFGAGTYSDHRWADGSGINGWGSWDYMGWQAGHNLEAGVGYMFVQLQMAAKQTYGTHGRSWFSVSVGLYREFF